MAATTFSDLASDAELKLLESKVNVLEQTVSDLASDAALRFLEDKVNNLEQTVSELVIEMEAMRKKLE